MNKNKADNGLALNAEGYVCDLGIDIASAQFFHASSSDAGSLILDMLALVMFVGAASALFVSLRK